jgi:putative SOS response-associated peptidase YedK
MCARFVSRILAAMERAVEIRWQDPFECIYNAAPTMNLSVVTSDRSGFSVSAMKWGLIPGWWKEARPPKLTINARFEEAADKAMWRGAFRGARCLVPALGWYEWRTEARVDTRTGEIADARQPYFVHLEGLAPLCFAGLWSRWSPEPGAEPLLTFSILTRPASPGLAELHDRMPVVLPASSYEEWLDPANADAVLLNRLVQTRAVSEFMAYPVTTYVNNPRNQGEQCLAPKTGTAPP